MKKIIAITMVFTLIALTGAAALAEISKADAKQIALEKVGLAENDVHFTECHKDFENVRQVYEVEFRKGTTEYEFDIDAGTGAVVDMDIDYLD